MVCVLMKILSHARAKKKTKRLKVFKFHSFNGRFQVISSSEGVNTIWTIYDFDASGFKIAIKNSSSNNNKKACSLRFGRKRVMLVAVLLHVVTALSMAWVPYFPLLCVMCWLNGMSVMGLYTNAYVIGKCSLRQRYQHRAA